MSAELRERGLRAERARISEREREVGIAGLPHRDRVFAAIWWLEAEVKNGGFLQWLFNSAGDHAELTLAALREVGADEVAAICERVFALLPGGRPHADRDARQAQLDTAESADPVAFERALTALDHRFYAIASDLRERLYEYTAN